MRPIEVTRFNLIIKQLQYNFFKIIGNFLRKIEIQLYGISLTHGIFRKFLMVPVSPFTEAKGSASQAHSISIRVKNHVD